MTATERPKLSGLESVRGLAAIAIVAFHLMAIHAPLPDGVLRSLVTATSGAVPIFFALSAFSLLYGYESSIFTRVGLTRFLVRRAFRILPLFYFMLIVYALKSVWEGAYISKSELLVNLAFLFPFVPGKHESLVWAGWSLGVEWIFYLLFPLVALTATKLRLGLALLVVLGLLSIAVARMVQDAGLADSFKSMCFGANLVHFQAGVVAFAWAARTRRNPSASTTLKTGRTAAFVGLGLLVVWFIVVRLIGGRMLDDIQWPTQLLTACLALVVVMLAFSGLPRSLDNRWTQRLGRHSYGIYLLHPFVLWLFSQMGAYQALNQLLADPTAVFCVTLALNFAIVLPAAALSYHCLERPAMRIGDALLSRWQRHAPI